MLVREGAKLKNASGGSAAVLSATGAGADYVKAGPYGIEVFVSSVFELQKAIVQCICFEKSAQFQLSFVGSEVYGLVSVHQGLYDF